MLRDLFSSVAEKNNFIDKLRELERRLNSLELRETKVTKVDEISSDLGDFQTGTAAGWELATDILSSGNGVVVLDSANEQIRVGTTDFLQGDGFFAGQSSGSAKMHVGNPNDKYLAWDGDDLTVVGDLTAIVDGQVIDLTAFTRAMKSPTGYIDRTGNTVSYNPFTRVLSILPTSPAATFDYYLNGARHTTAGLTWTAHSNVVAGYFLYIDTNNQLQVSTNIWSILTTAPSIYIYYYSASKYLLIEERHGANRVSLPWHQADHLKRGTYWYSGFSISGVEAAPISPTNAKNQPAITSGVMFDEDLRHAIAALSAGTYNVFHREITTGNWTWESGSTIAHVGTNYIAYNNPSGWGWSELSNGEYTCVYLMIVPSLVSGTEYLFVSGQAKYNGNAAGLSQAQAESPSMLNWGTFPVPEALFAYKFILETGNSYGTTGKFRVKEYTSLLSLTFQQVVNIITALNATSGTVGGWSIGSTALSGGNLTLDSTGEVIAGSGTDTAAISGKDADYRIWSGSASAISAPFRVSKSGDVTANNINARGSIITNVLVKDGIQATGGTLILAKSAGKLRTAVTSVASPTTFKIEVDDPASGHAALFAVNDILRIGDGVSTNWVLVGTVTDKTTYYEYTVTRQSGSNATFTPGAVVLDYGVSGNGILEMTADSTNSPYYSVKTHVGSPWSAMTEILRLGNLKGFLGEGSERYGLMMTNGEIRLGTGTPSTDFTGTRMVYPAGSSGSTSYNLATFDDDVLQVALNTSGQLVAGAGEVIVDSDGIDIRQIDDENVNLLKFSLDAYTNPVATVAGYGYVQSANALGLQLLVDHPGLASGSPNGTMRAIVHPHEGGDASIIIKTQHDLTTAGVGMYMESDDAGDGHIQLTTRKGLLLDTISTGKTPAINNTTIFAKLTGLHQILDGTSTALRLLSESDVPRGAWSGFDAMELKSSADAYKAFTRIFNASGTLGMHAYQSSPANGDKIIFYFTLQDGEYTFCMIGVKYPDEGKSDLYVDDVKVNGATPYDWYAAATTLNQTWTVTGITLTTSGLHKFEIRVNGKNASSSNYFIAGSYVTVYRTGGR